MTSGFFFSCMILLLLFVDLLEPEVTKHQQYDACRDGRYEKDCDQDFCDAHIFAPFRL
jgi:hypothetical protein